MPWHGIDIEIERQRSEIAVDVHTVVFEAKLLMQMPRGSERRAVVVDVDVEFRARWDRPPEGLEQAREQARVRTPHSLRTELDHAVEPIKCAKRFELPVKTEDRGTK